MGQKQSTVSNTESESKSEKDLAPLCADAVLNWAEPRPQGPTAQRQIPTLITPCLVMQDELGERVCPPQIPMLES